VFQKQVMAGIAKVRMKSCRYEASKMRIETI
jgi:hypothetical protein